VQGYGAAAPGWGAGLHSGCVPDANGKRNRLLTRGKQVA